MTIIKETPKRVIVQLDDRDKTRCNVNNLKGVEIAFFYSLIQKDYIFYLRLIYKSGTRIICYYDDPELRDQEFIHLYRWIKRDTE